jgi:Fic family protein
VEQVAALRERIQGAAVQVAWIPALQKDTRARNAHSSTAIEGNPLTLEQVRAVEAGEALAVPASARRAGRCWALRSIGMKVGGYVPPPHGAVPGLVRELFDWWNDEAPALSPVLSSAIVHYRFEAIHPFADGNGRTGRALIHVILRRRGIAPSFVPPISLVLATRAADYVDGLTRTRYVGPPDGPDAREGLNEWIAFFAGACRRAVADAQEYERHVAELQQTWRARLGRVRRDSATELLLDALPGAPVLTVQSAAAMIGRSVQAVNEAVARLADAQVLTQTTIGKRNRAFEAPELIDAFTALERQLASPEADTRTSPPVRRVPGRRRG